jgi:hypothetical protein
VVEQGLLHRASRAELREAVVLVYQRGWHQMTTGALAWDANLKAILLRSTYTPNRDHDYIADISAHEAGGPGCTSGFGASGRKALTGATVTLDDANDRANLVGPTSLVWVGINTAQVAGFAIAREKTSDADSPLVAYFDFTPVTPQGGTLTVAFTDGIFATVE